jgi:hypothetical protein
MSEETLQKAVQWGVFNVLLALLPIIVNFILAAYLKVPNRWMAVLKDGELFIFSSTVAATSLGQKLADFLSPNSRINQSTLIVEESTRVADSVLVSHVSDSPVAGMIIIASLLLVMALSSALFALSSYYKLEKKEPPNPGFVVAGSVACAAMSSLFGFFLYLM